MPITAPFDVYVSAPLILIILFQVYGKLQMFAQSRDLVLATRCTSCILLLSTHNLNLQGVIKE